MLLALLGPACGGSTESGSAGGHGGAGSTGSGSAAAGSGAAGSGGGAAGSGATSSGGGVQCTGEKPMFPMFDKSCDSPASCLVKFHTINCCGTQVALGLSVSASAAFDKAEATCAAMYPACECATQPTKAEDGKEAIDTSVIKVDCKAGSCSSFVP
jgi:hypothetical protein